MADQHSTTKWHRLFAHLLRELLTPVGLTVHTEFPISTDPPKIDVVIIKRESKEWTAEQKALLPDGIRDSQASHILLEFKYTESFNIQAIRQILGYETFYRNNPKRGQKLSAGKVQSFLVVSKTPRTTSLDKFGYHPTPQKGIYQSDNVLLADLKMLVLNKLGNEAHNIYFKLFASRQVAKREAVAVLRKKGLWQSLAGGLQIYLQGLLALWFVVRGDEEMRELTPEQMIEAGKVFKEYVLPMMSLEERLVNVSPRDISEEELNKIPFIYRIKEKGIEEGIEKGIEKGERRAKIKALSQIVTLRFGVERGKFEVQLTKLSLKVLNELTEIALTVESLSDFEKALNNEYLKN